MVICMFSCCHQVRPWIIRRMHCGITQCIALAVRIIYCRCRMQLMCVLCSQNNRLRVPGQQANIFRTYRRKRKPTGGVGASAASVSKVAVGPMWEENMTSSKWRLRSRKCPAHKYRLTGSLSWFWCCDALNVHNITLSVTHVNETLQFNHYCCMYSGLVLVNANRI